jgi:hypothetical protein
MTTVYEDGAMSVTIAGVSFDHHDYDKRGDVR